MYGGNFMILRDFSEPSPRAFAMVSVKSVLLEENLEGGLVMELSSSICSSGKKTLIGRVKTLMQKSDYCKFS